MFTVDPPNNGHVWDLLFFGHFVLCREVVLYQRLRIIRTIGKSPFGTLNLVLCSEVISIVSFIGVSFIGGSTVHFNFILILAIIYSLRNVRPKVTSGPTQKSLFCSIAALLILAPEGDCLHAGIRSDKVS